MNKHIIWIKAKCDNYYRFMSKIELINIPILEIKYQNQNIYLKIEEKHLEKLKKYLVSYKFKKVSDLGIYQILNKIKDNHIFLIAIILGLILYFFLTNVIVKVNIVHQSKEIRDLLKEELKERGIKTLSLKKSYEKLDKIKKEILDAYPDKLDWLEFEIDGMVYNVRVEERIITDTKKEEKTCDIVAKKNGTVSNIKLYNGEVIVDLNDYVRQGDTLISGKVIYNENITRNICASGEVYANVWYTVDVSIPFKYYESTQTGKKKYNIMWEVNENKRRLLKKRFTNFDSNLHPILKIFDFSLYLESEYETIENEKYYSEEEALNMALNKAEENIKKKISDKDTIIDKKVLKKDVNNSTMEVEIFVIVNELISEEKITIEEAKDEGVE